MRRKAYLVFGGTSGGTIPYGQEFCGVYPTHAKALAVVGRWPVASAFAIDEREVTRRELEDIKEDVVDDPEWETYRP